MTGLPLTVRMLAASALVALGAVRTQGAWRFAYGDFAPDVLRFATASAAAAASGDSSAADERERWGRVVRAWKAAYSDVVGGVSPPDLLRRACDALGWTW